MKTLLLPFAFFLVISSFAQSWQKIEENSHFSIFVSELEYRNSSDGIDHHRFVFKYENHTNEPLTIYFNRELQYDNGTAFSQEQDFTVTIPAKGVSEYSDSTIYDKTYYIFKKDNNHLIQQSLLDFKILNLRIN